MGTRPLPPHGTYARGNGSPGRRPACACPPCRDARRQTRKRLKVARELGKGARIDATAAREHLHKLRATMSWAQIQAITGCDIGGLYRLSTGQRTVINRSTQDRLLAVRPGAEPSDGMYFDATGPRRRLQALAVLGYSRRELAERTGSAEARLAKIAGGKQPTVRYTLVRRINRVYDELSQTPAPPRPSRIQVVRHARNSGWAPPAAWDDDTIDNPDAHPEWTGYCGTDRGWWTHKLQRIPVCPRCETAHTEWREQHKNLPQDERFRAVGRARAEASSREADLAHDAREIKRLTGADDEQTAARLGVTRQHLQQALRRNPEADYQAAA
ncbi:hypothetical protein [Streptomyces zhihengii]